MALKLIPCKKCNHIPSLYTPSKYDPEYRNQNGLLSNFEPAPYYRCDFCKAMAELEKENERIKDWNNKNAK